MNPLASLLRLTALGGATGLLVACGAIAEPTSGPSSAPTSAATSAAPAGASALAAVAGLEVKGRAPRTGYSREAFGQAWFDADRNGCDTRNDVLRRDLIDKDMKNPCKVLAGTLEPDPFTGRDIRFELGGASEVDIDHVVALSDAWQKGAGRWSEEKRLAFANDPLNLLAVDATENRSKGDSDAATWLPPNRFFRCTYVARQAAVKQKYELWVPPAERDAMVRVLTGCAGTETAEPGPAPTEAVLPRRKRPTAESPTSVFLHRGPSSRCRSRPRRSAGVLPTARLGR